MTSIRFASLCAACALAALASGHVLAQAQAQTKAKQAPSASRVEIRTKAANMAAAVEAVEAALTPAELAIAERVHVGQLPCEEGVIVTMTADPKAPGHFDLRIHKLHYRLAPVETSTGAVRLEDKKAGAVWLQLANKSMLMNQKLGRRLADECMSPAQAAVAEVLKKNPAPSLLDAPAPSTPTAKATQ